MQQLSTKFQTAMQDGVLSGEEAEELLDFMREKAGMEDDPAVEEAPDAPEEGWEEDTPAEAEAAATEI
jgi:hypothetical protein